MEDYIVVIGAANIDIGGNPYNKLIKNDSNPGKITISYGGVGRNIAENLSMLGMNVKLVVAMGNDALGRDLLEYCKKCGIDTSYTLIDDGNSSMYMYINNVEGDMAIALSDVDIAHKITPSYLDSIEKLINNAQVVVMDCNVTHELFMHLKKICKVPIFIDPVSQSHASKIKNHLNGINTTKPNRLEAEYLTDIPIESLEDYKKAAEEILSQGVKRVFISMGSDGMLAAQDNDYYLIDKYPVEVKSTTGAGDSAGAALIWSLSDKEYGQDIIRAAEAANAAASVTVESGKTINHELSEELIIQRIEEGKMKVHKI